MAMGVSVSVYVSYLFLWSARGEEGVASESESGSESVTRSIISLAISAPKCTTVKQVKEKNAKGF